MKTIDYIVLILCVLAVFDMPYSYYEIFRVIAFGAFLLYAYENYRKLVYLEYQVKPLYYYVLFWFSSALIVQPFYKLVLGKDIWIMLDILWASVILISIIRERRLKSK